MAAGLENRLNVGKNRSRETSEEAQAVFQLRDDDGLHRGGDGRGSEECPDSGYILK